MLSNLAPGTHDRHLPGFLPEPEPVEEDHLHPVDDWTCTMCATPVGWWLSFHGDCLTWYDCWTVDGTDVLLCEVCYDHDPRP